MEYSTSHKTSLKGYNPCWLWSRDVFDAICSIINKWL